MRCSPFGLNVRTDTAHNCVHSCLKNYTLGGTFSQIPMQGTEIEIPKVERLTWLLAFNSSRIRLNV